MSLLSPSRAMSKIDNEKINIEKRLSIGGRTIYALLGPGLYARSGMSPVVLLKIWNTYAVTRYLYGLEIQAYTPLDTKKLEQLQRVFLILQMNNLSSSFEFSISHMSISFSMDESSLAKVVNKIIAFLSSVVSIGSAPISV
jgi:2C-methyl-D-erythritol 2,4-cyclodiphosphate synthase